MILQHEKAFLSKPKLGSRDGLVGAGAKSHPISQSPPTSKRKNGVGLDSTGAKTQPDKPKFSVYIKIISIQRKNSPKQSF